MTKAVTVIGVSGGRLRHLRYLFLKLLLLLGEFTVINEI